MRGTVSTDFLLQVQEGITPAHAGNRLFDAREAFDSKDHPRSCGEQPSITRKIYQHVGSPPLMRGTEECYMTIYEFGRITPAHAGNRNADSLFSDQAKDHPRSCGEQLKTMCLILTITGSPPLMRGTAFIFHIYPPISRITPAHAGNSIRAVQYSCCSRDHPRSCGEQRG